MLRLEKLEAAPAEAYSNIKRIFINAFVRAMAGAFAAGGIMTAQNLKQEDEIMNKDYLLKWVKAAGIRAVKTMAQTAVATTGTTVAMSEINWVLVGSTAALAGILSLLTSAAGLPELKFPKASE